MGLNKNNKTKEISIIFKLKFLFNKLKFLLGFFLFFFCYLFSYKKMLLKNT